MTAEKIRVSPSGRVMDVLVPPTVSDPSPTKFLNELGEYVEIEGGVQNLAQVLEAGNLTGGHDVVLQNGGKLSAAPGQNVRLQSFDGGNIVLESANSLVCTSPINILMSSRYNITISTDDDPALAGGINLTAGKSDTDLGASIAVRGGNSVTGGGDLELKAGSSDSHEGGNLILESGEGATQGRGDILVNVPTTAGRVIYTIGGNGACCVFDRETAHFTTQSDSVSNIKLLTNNVDLAAGIRAGIQDPQVGAVPGVDGDLYIRAAGALSNIYQMRGGAWVAV